MKKILSIINLMSFLIIFSSSTISCRQIYNLDKLDKDIAKWDLNADGIFNPIILNDTLKYSVQNYKNDLDSNDSYYLFNANNALIVTNSPDKQDKYGPHYYVDALKFIDYALIYHEQRTSDYSASILKDNKNMNIKNNMTKVNYINSINAINKTFNINVYDNFMQSEYGNDVHIQNPKIEQNSDNINDFYIDENESVTGKILDQKQNNINLKDKSEYGSIVHNAIPFTMDDTPSSGSIGIDLKFSYIISLKKDQSYFTNSSKNYMDNDKTTPIIFGAFFYTAEKI